MKIENLMKDKSPLVRYTARTMVVVVAFLAIGLWAWMFSDKAHAAPQTHSVSGPRYCGQIGSGMNYGMSYSTLCKWNPPHKHMDHTMKYIYNCGGQSLIAGFVGGYKGAAGAAAACVWATFWR